MSQEFSSKMESAADSLNLQGPNTDNLVSDPALDYLTAWNLVASGNFDEAERLLRKNGELPSSVAALDLLARIAVQKGQYEQAGNCGRPSWKKTRLMTLRKPR